MSHEGMRIHLEGMRLPHEGMRHPHLLQQMQELAGPHMGGQAPHPLMNRPTMNPSNMPPTSSGPVSMAHQSMPPSAMPPMSVASGISQPFTAPSTVSQTGELSTPHGGTTAAAPQHQPHPAAGQDFKPEVGVGPQILQSQQQPQHGQGPLPPAEGTSHHDPHSAFQQQQPPNVSATTASPVPATTTLHAELAAGKPAGEAGSRASTPGGVGAGREPGSRASTPGGVAACRASTPGGVGAGRESAGDSTPGQETSASLVQLGSTASQGAIRENNGDVGNSDSNVEAGSESNKDIPQIDGATDDVSDNEGDYSDIDSVMDSWSCGHGNGKAVMDFETLSDSDDGCDNIPQLDGANDEEDKAAKTEERNIGEGSEGVSSGSVSQAAENIAPVPSGQVAVSSAISIPDGQEKTENCSVESDGQGSFSRADSESISNEVQKDSETPGVSVTSTMLAVQSDQQSIAEVPVMTGGNVSSPEIKQTELLAESTPSQSPEQLTIVSGLQHQTVNDRMDEGVVAQLDDAAASTTSAASHVEGFQPELTSLTPAHCKSHAEPISGPGGRLPEEGLATPTATAVPSDGNSNIATVSCTDHSAPVPNTMINATMQQSGKSVVVTPAAETDGSSNLSMTIFTSELGKISSTSNETSVTEPRESAATNSLSHGAATAPVSVPAAITSLPHGATMAPVSAPAAITSLSQGAITVPVVCALADETLQPSVAAASQFMEGRSVKPLESQPSYSDMPAAASVVTSNPGQTLPVATNCSSSSLANTSFEISLTSLPPTAQTSNAASSGVSTPLTVSSLPEPGTRQIAYGDVVTVRQEGGQVNMGFPFSVAASSASATATPIHVNAMSSQTAVSMPPSFIERVSPQPLPSSSVAITEEHRTMVSQLMAGSMAASSLAQALTSPNAPGLNAIAHGLNALAATHTIVPHSAGVSHPPSAPASAASSRPHLPALTLDSSSMHYPPDHPLAGQPRPPLDMLAQVSNTALSSAGSAIPASQPSPPVPVSQPSPEMMNRMYQRHLVPPHITQPGISQAPGVGPHSPTVAYSSDGGFTPRPIYPGMGGPRYRAMGPEYPQNRPMGPMPDFAQNRGIMSPPAMSPTSPSPRGQRPQFPPYPMEMMHSSMSPRPSLPPRMIPPDMMNRPVSGGDPHMMVHSHMPGYSQHPNPSQVMMNRPPYGPMHPPHSGAMEFGPRSPHPGMPGFPPQVPRHSPSPTSPRLQGPGFPPQDPRLMSPDPHMMTHGDPRMARVFADQQRMSMMRQRLPMMQSGAAAFPPQHRAPPPRHPIFPDEGMDHLSPLPHSLSISTPPGSLASDTHMGSMGPGGPFHNALSMRPSAMGGLSGGLMESGLKALDIAVNQVGMPAGHMIKLEPNLDHGDLDDPTANLDMDQRAKHALLKQLLSKEQQQAVMAELRPPSTSDSEESLPQLTPEQQRQLALIDMMPLCKETESSSDVPEWDAKNPEEREQLQDCFSELRKQEYEKKRKQYEAVRKKRKNQPSSNVEEGKPKVKKRRKQTAVANTGPMDTGSLAVQDLSAEPAQTSVAKKRRGRKNRESKMEQRESELEFMAETFLQQLHSLPSVALREPDISAVFSLVPVKGAALVTGASLLHGTFGQAYLNNELDSYSSLSYPPPPPGLRVTPTSGMPKQIFAGRGAQHSPEVSKVAAAPSSTAPMAESSPPLPLPICYSQDPAAFALPNHPRIEVKHEPFRDTPDTIISSSSPECGFMEKEPDYSSLRLIEPASPMSGADDKYSPTVPLVHPIPTYPSAKFSQSGLSQDIKPSLLNFAGSAGSAMNAAPSQINTESAHAAPVPPSSMTSAMPSIVPKQEPDTGPPAEAPGQDLTVKIPTMTSGFGHPFMETALDQKVSVTLTLSANAAEDIGGVISAIADLLKIAVPPTYEITRTPSPEMFKLNLTHKEDVINIQALMRTKPTFCGHCHVVLLNSGIRKHKSELPAHLLPDDLEEEEVTWCSMNCMNQFMQTAPSLEETDSFDEDSSNNSNSTIIMDGSDKSDSRMETDDARDLRADSPSASSPKRSVTDQLSVCTESPSLSLSASATTQPDTPNTPTPGQSSVSSPAASPAPSLVSPSLRVGGFSSPHQVLLSPTLRGKDEKPGKRHRRTSSTQSQEGYTITKPFVKRWRDSRWKRWDPSLKMTKLPDIPVKEINDLWDTLQMTMPTAELPSDKRVCEFCHDLGDGEADGPGRLLNLDVNKWVHLNCALWSMEVIELLSGSLTSVQTAYARSLTTECCVCKKMGATLGCFKPRCPNKYHVPCAKRKECFFYQDKTITCASHTNYVKPFVNEEMSSIEVKRRVYIAREEEKQVASIVCSLITPDEGQHTLRIGSLILHTIGQLLPHQIATNKFNTEHYIFPVGYKATRFFWSVRRLYKRCKCLLSIAERDGAPEFIMQVKEKDFEDVTFRNQSPSALLMMFIKPLSDMRFNADMVRIFPHEMKMEEIFGLSEPAIVRILESLPGADLLQGYKFKYGRSPYIEMPPAINPTGCARTEPKLRTHFRSRPHTVHGSSTSSSRTMPTSLVPVPLGSVGADLNSPYTKQFVHSKAQQYRKLKAEWKSLVYLGRSRIQGLGLYAARDLEKHTMVIEYIGDLIRNEVANRREKEYDNQNRGVYMFRIDNDTVVDATMAGGPARYINHSCSPNCTADIVQIEKDNKIIIITSRRIPKGEELTYDYKFDFEDDQHKIPCLCGAAFCRKWMN